MTNQHPCCWAGVAADGSCTGVKDDHLGPIEDPHDTVATTSDGHELPAKAGFRRCGVCGARHYFISVDPIPLGIAGASL